MAESAYTIVIKNHIEELDTLNQQLYVFFNDHSIEKEARFVIMLCIEEMVTNIIKYGYSDDAIHDIEISLEPTDTSILLLISDDGDPFNPIETKEPDTHMPLSERPIGGLGIHLTKKMSSHIAYAREDERNILSIEIERSAGT